MIDIIVVAIVLVTALVGYMMGVLRAVIWLAAAFIAFMASRALMPGIIRLLGGIIGESGIAVGALQIVLGMMIFVSALAAGRVLNRRLGRTEKGDLRPWNRQFGAVVGFIAGIGLGLIVLLGLDTYAAMMDEEDTGQLAASVRNSHLRRAIQPHNPLRTYLLPDALPVLWQARKDPQVLEDLREEPHIQDLLEEPRVQDILEDEELRQAIENRNLGVLVESEKIQALFADEDLRARIFSKETRQALQRVEQKAEERRPEPAEEEETPEQ